MLVERGYRVRAVLNGARALAAAEADPPDLVLLDIRMPEMSGYETCRRLKANERLHDIPVLFISALDETEDKVHAFAVGGVDYVTKPIQAEEVLARVETHLRLHRLQLQLEQEVRERDRLIADLDAYAHTVAHDLKNPLNIIVNYADLLLEGDDALSPAEIREELQNILAGGLKMKTIIDSLLLLASTHHEHIVRQPLNMGAIVDEALKRLAGEIAQRRAEIVCPETWPDALGYAPWVEEIWINYLSNALSYGGRPDATPPVPPHIELGVSNDCPPFLQFWVRDDGVGISLEDQARLFTPFNRAHIGALYRSRPGALYRAPHCRALRWGGARGQRRRAGQHVQLHAAPSA